MKRTQKLKLKLFSKIDNKKRADEDTNEKTLIKRLPLCTVLKINYNNKWLLLLFS